MDSHSNRPSVVDRKTMAKLTSAGAFLSCTRPEFETVDDQIERLNKYIENLMGSRTPVRKTLNADESENFAFVTETRRVSSFSSQEGFEFRLSEAFAGDDEEYLAKFEQLAQSVDRALMTSEDFRSFEHRRFLTEAKADWSIEELATLLDQELGLGLAQRNFDGLVMALRGLTQHRVTCQVFDLYKMHSDLEKIISLAEDELCFEGKVSLGPFECTVLLEYPGLVYTEKDRLRGYLRRPPPQLPRAMLEFGKELQQQMQTSADQLYRGTLHSIECLDYKFKGLVADHRLRKPPLMHLELRQLMKTKVDHATLKRNLEWECADVAMIKTVYKQREQELMQAKDFITKQSQLIKERVVQLEKDRVRFEDEFTMFEFDQVQYREQQRNTREIVARLKGELMDLMSSDAPKTERSIKVSANPYHGSRPGTPHSEREELDEQDLKDEIAELEVQLCEASPGEKDKIAFRLTRLKTQLSNLRSQRVIATSVNADHSFKTIKTRMQNNWGQKNFGLNNSYSAIPKEDRSFEFGKRTSRAPSISSIDSESMEETSKALISPRSAASPLLPPSVKPPRLAFPKPKPIQLPLNIPSQVPPPYAHQPSSHQHSSMAPIQSTELRKEVDLIKVRLKEREEELEANEKHLQKLWMQVPGAERLIPLIEQEQTRLSTKKHNLDRGFEELDKLNLTAAERTTRLKQREAEVTADKEKLTDELTQQFYRKHLIENKLSSLIESLYDY